MQLIGRLTIAIALLTSCAVDGVAQNPLMPKTTQVLVTLTIKDGVSQEELMKTMPAEVRATVQLYLDGHIQQWYSQAGARGVVFIVDSKSTDEAKALMEGLPLARQKLATLEYMPLGPLLPLRLLLGPATR